MALSLGIKNGSKFLIGKDRMTVMEVGPGQRATVKVNDSQMMMVTDLCRTEVLPEVFVSFGPTRAAVHGINSCRLAFEAPRSIAITRV